MSPTAQAALDRARRPTPAPAPAPAPAYSTETAYRPKPIPVLVVRGPINEYMRQQAREDARDMVRAHRAKLNDTNGVAQVIEVLKRAAAGRPGSVVQGFIDVIQVLQEHGQ
ncbi:hypothetical protein V9K81_08635 [Pseudomonas monteilii]|uniref:hypothetical protein n=1 Tax=Pseudomonas monteilii TaxID=76759 RepID=UPI0030CC841D